MGVIQLGILVMVWFTTITGLSTFAYVYGGMHATGPNFQLWVIGMIFVNVACVLRLVSVIVHARVMGKL